MRSLSHLADHVLLHDLKSLVVRECGTTAELLAHLAEAEERRLHLPAAYPSMHAYCVGELHFSDSEAFKRIQAARAARRFPAILEAVAAGRLHLSAVLQLAPHLTVESADELITAATHRTKAELALVIARHCSRKDEPSQRVPEPVEFLEKSTGLASADALELTAGTSESGSSPAVQPVAAPLRGRFDLRATLDQEAHDLLLYAKALLGHAIPSGDLALVLKRALAGLVQAEEKRIFAAHCRTRPRRGTSIDRRVPAEIRRAVWLREGGRCTFTSETGTRCSSRTRIEFDHVTPVAKGGESTATNLRLCCRAHNQYAADRTFGAGFMAGKRVAARGRAAQRRERKAAAQHASTSCGTEAQALAEPESSFAPAPGLADPDSRRAELIPWLRRMGMRVDEARHGAAMCDHLSDASLEQRVKFALAALARERDRLRPHAAQAAARVPAQMMAH